MQFNVATRHPNSDDHSGWSTDEIIRPFTSCDCSGGHSSPMSNLWDTMRVPRASSRRNLGISCRLSFGSREDRDDGGLADVGLEQILVQKPHAVADAGLGHVVPRHPQVERVDLDRRRRGRRTASRP